MSKTTYIFASLLLLATLVWLGVLYSPDNNLHVIACDVGQGDAILITQGNNQILIDAGKGKKVMECLSRHLPFWDKTIEMIIITHPQLDHYGGFNDVLAQFDVKSVLSTSIDSDAQEFQALKSGIGSSGTRVIDAVEGKSVKIGMIRFDIVNPSADFVTQNSDDIDTNNAEKVLGTRISDIDPNDFSIVTKMSYGNFDALFTGDIGPAVIDDLVATGNIDKVEYIKVPHHGSRNGMTPRLLENTSPEIAVISVGKNQWGHPHQEVLDMLRNSGVKTLRTDQAGDIEVVSDGERFWIE